MTDVKPGQLWMYRSPDAFNERSFSIVLSVDEPYKVTVFDVWDVRETGVDHCDFKHFVVSDDWKLLVDVI